jgi:hypothetical protein
VSNTKLEHGIRELAAKYASTNIEPRTALTLAAIGANHGDVLVYYTLDDVIRAFEAGYWLHMRASQAERTN